MKLKRIMVLHRRFCDNIRTSLEMFLCKQYHAANCYISNGDAVITWFQGNYGDYKEVNVFKALFKAVISDKKAPLPSNWKEIAELWIFAGISISTLEKELKADIIDVSDEFFDYARKLEDEYFGDLRDIIF